jgi:hypothetical protein
MLGPLPDISATSLPEGVSAEQWQRNFAIASGAVGKDSPLRFDGNDSVGEEDEKDSALTAQERLEGAGEFKALGNAAFKSADYPKAHTIYKNGLRLLSGWDEQHNWDDDIEQLLTSLHLNRAASGLKLKKWVGVIQSASWVLKHDGSNTKALYRRGVAYLHSGKLKQAKADLMLLAQIDPRNKQARNGLADLKDRLILSKQTHAANVAEAFARGGIGDKKEEAEEREREAMKEEKQEEQRVKDGLKQSGARDAPFFARGEHVFSAAEVTTAQDHPSGAVDFLASQGGEPTTSLGKFLGNVNVAQEGQSAVQQETDQQENQREGRQQGTLASNVSSGYGLRQELERGWEGEQEEETLEQQRWSADLEAARRERGEAKKEQLRELQARVLHSLPPAVRGGGGGAGGLGGGFGLQAAGGGLAPLAPLSAPLAPLAPASSSATVTSSGSGSSSSSSSSSGSGSGSASANRSGVSGTATATRSRAPPQAPPAKAPGKKSR